LTLYHLLIAASSTMFLAGGIAEAKLAKGGFVGYALAAVIGLVLGALNAWMVYASGKWVYERTKLLSAGQQNAYVRALYSVVAVWIPIALFLGSWITRGLMRVVK